MLIWPGVKIFLNAAAGRPPAQRDLDEIVRTLRRRLIAGKTIRPPSGPKLSPAFLQRRLRALQLRKFRRTLKYVSRHVPFYERQLLAAGVQAGDLRSLEDVQKLPLTYRADFEPAPQDFISRAPGMTPSVYMSSGGTTKAPLVGYLTPDEFERYTSLQAIAGMTYGFLGPQHITQMHQSFDGTISSKIYNLAAFKSGTLVLTPGLSGQLDVHLDSLLKRRDLPGKLPQVTVLSGAPGLIWALAERSLERGYGPKDFSLRRVFATGAKVSEALKAKVKAAWDIQMFEAYSLTEVFPAGAFQCDHGQLHFLDFSGFLEVLDPQTRRPVPPGGTGVAVITSFYPDRELMPVIRYWTDDLMRLPEKNLCPCGLVTTPIAEITGRLDYMINVGGQNVYPQPVGDALLTFPELVRPPRFQMRVEERPGAYVAIIEVELAAPLPEAARQALAKRISDATFSTMAIHAMAGVVKCEVRLLPAGTIDKPFPYKLQGVTPV